MLYYYTSRSLKKNKGNEACITILTLSSKTINFNNKLLFPGEAISRIGNVNSTEK